MNFVDYKKLKELDIQNETENVKVLLVNGTPALRFKKYNPDTGDLLNDVGEAGIDVPGWKKTIEELQRQIEGINELIDDAEALTAE